MDQLIKQIEKAVSLGYKVTFEKADGWNLAISVEENENRPLGLVVEGQVTQILPLDQSHTSDKRVSECLGFIINKQLTQSNENSIGV